MLLVGYMTPTGYQYPPPESGPQGVAHVNVDPPRSILHFEVQFTDVRTPLNKKRFYVVAGDKIIGGRDLPPPTDGTITDDWPAPSQVVQSIVANPSNAIVYVEAPPSTLPREYLPGGVVLNSGSPWARLQPPPPSDVDANL
jgi:hypothetical protein